MGSWAGLRWGSDRAGETQEFRVKSGYREKIVILN